MRDRSERETPWWEEVRRLDEDAELLAVIEHLEAIANDVTDPVGAHSIFADATTLRDRVAPYCDFDMRLSKVEGQMMGVLYKHRMAESGLSRARPLTEQAR